MAYMNEFLIRDSLYDIGTVGHNYSYCASPDLICHELVLNPADIFGSAASYATSPSAPINRSSKNNPLYTRVKSLQTAPGDKKGYLRVYRASSSLFMNPSLWRNNPLSTPKGQKYVTVTARQNGDIAVADDVFMIDGSQANFCLVGIVNDSPAETLPADFRTYNDFIMWVVNNPSVAVRNFSVFSSGQANSYEAMHSVINPESETRFGGVDVISENIPEGTVFGMECAPLGISKTSTYRASDPNSASISDAAHFPANLDTYVRVYGRLPSGGTWPTGARLHTTYYVHAEENEAMFAHARPLEECLSNLSGMDNSGPPKRLVRMGSCSVEFK